ncbi:MAG: ATP synthase F1 subunit gamma [Chloroflexota bacterium]|nr:ATP synthase F1 subunit gamma [Chloroflexota bacterium]
MASLRDIRTRIRSVKNISQITRAMQMVAASRMRRAQESVAASRPFSEKIRQVLAGVGDAAPTGEGPLHPLLERREVQNIDLVLITSDRGLAGGFNANALRLASNFLLKDAGAPVNLLTLGRKGRDYMVRYGRNVIADFSELGDAPGLDAVTPVARTVTERFTAGETDAVYMVYTKYISTLNQTPRIEQLLPIEPPTEDEEREAQRGPDYIYEPSPVLLLQALLPRYVEVRLYQALLESKASEHSSRMVAMRNATDAANDIVDDLSLTYNKARQAAITREIIEIGRGAAALEG